MSGPRARLVCRMQPAGDGSVSPHFKRPEGHFEAEPPQPRSPPPSPEPQTKRAAWEDGLQVPAANPGKGAQVTAAPGNRCPGNRWQLQGLRHCPAPTQHSAGPDLSCAQVPLLGRWPGRELAGRRAEFRTPDYGVRWGTPAYVCQY